MIREVLTRARDRAADAAVAALVGGPVRALLFGTALLWIAIRCIGWWTVALILAGAAWELTVWLGRAPGRWM